LYPNLEIKYNSKEEIHSELDIYIPKYKLAFELNGIFHYEPIFGGQKLEQTQNNDKNKFQLCQENKISLCVIDTSSLKYFKEQNAEKYPAPAGAGSEHPDYRGYGLRQKLHYQCFV
jgi:hypothetical protein